MNQNTRWLFIVLLSLLVLLSVRESFYITEKFGGSDLRCRIVGSRLLFTDSSPYFYKWHDGDNIIYLDPNDRLDRKANGNVLTPAVLLLNKPLSFFSYKWIRILWTVIQYCLFGLSLFFIWKASGSRKDLLLPITLILFGFLMSAAWFNNIERGQTYIFYVFIFSLCYFLFTREGKYGHFFAGAIAGLAIWIRPLFLFVHLPFLLVKDRRWLMGSAVGFFAGLLIFFIPMQSSWNDYRVAMKHYEWEAAGTEFVGKVNNSIVPGNIEGVSNLRIFRTGPNAGGLANVQGYMRARGIILDSMALVIMFSFILILMSFLFLRRSKAKPQKETGLFLFAFFLYMLSELFVVGTRAGYNVIEWLFAYGILLIAGYKNSKLYVLLALAIAFMNGWPFEFPHQGSIGELIAFYVLIDFIFIQRGSSDTSKIVYDYSA